MDSDSENEENCEVWVEICSHDLSDREESGESESEDEDQAGSSVSTAGLRRSFSQTTTTQQSKKRKQSNSSNSVPKEFHPLDHNQREQQAFLKLPQYLDKTTLIPFHIFSLFFPQYLLLTLVENTNIYAKSKHSEKKEEGHVWNALTLEELNVFLALIIYMGYSGGGPLESYWQQGSYSKAEHSITKLMPLYRFKQVLRSIFHFIFFSHEFLI